MNSEQFVNNIKNEIESLVALYSKGSVGQTDLGIKLSAMDLSPQLEAQVTSLIDQAVKEAIYTVISGLEGSASLGGCQEEYKIIAENGNIISGELDDLFYEQVIEQGI